jgi:hypothetical protein
MAQLESAVDGITIEQINTALEENARRKVSWGSPSTVNCPTIGAVVAAPHDLGVTPTDLDVTPWVNGTWWADSSDRRLWSSTIICFHASAVGQYTVKAGVQ